MKIIIVGAGFTGIQLARRLIAERNDVILIDNDEEIVRHASNRLDCMVMQANGNSLKTLEEAGIAKADALVAVTSSDEVNMITCSLAESIYPDIVKIARVRNYDYYPESKAETEVEIQTDQHLYGIDFMVHPDVEAAQAIVTAVEHGAVSEALDFGDSGYELTRMTVEKGSSFDGACLQNLRQLTENPFLVAFVEKGGVASMPTGSTILNADDRIGILTKREKIPDFLALCGTSVQVFNKIALLGAGRIGTSIAEKFFGKEKRTGLGRLFDLKKRITQKFVIIDPDEQLTKNMAEKFPSARVLLGDVSDESLIEEEGLSSFDLVIAATRNHEKNMISSAYLKSIGVEKTVCLVSSGNYALIAKKLGIDVAVPIRDAVVDTIMSHLRGKGVTGVHTISEGGIEIVELTLPENFAMEGKTLKEIAEPGSFLVLLVCKKDSDKYEIAGGNTVLNAGDKIVVIEYSKDKMHITEKFGESK